MFGKKSISEERRAEAAVQPVVENELQAAHAPVQVRKPAQVPATAKPENAEQYYSLKKEIFSALIATIDVAALSNMDGEQARNEIGAIINDIVAAKKAGISMAEQNDLLSDICNDILVTARSSPCSHATTSPTSWSMAQTRSSSKSTAECRRRESAFATTSSYSISASASSARLAGASTNRALSATRVWATVPVST